MGFFGNWRFIWPSETVEPAAKEIRFGRMADMRQHPWLEYINSPADLKKIPAEDLPGLCAEIREFLLQRVSQTGGHLASNLGAVELTVAVHRVFSAPKDDILFDVGHQCYVHKMLTGRRDQFGTLRQFGGISGFLRPEESSYDCAVTGHASSSVSVALGMARAKRITGKEGATVCIIGDGALTGGMAYEAMNDAGQSGLPLLVIFNDNDMSISPNVGAIAKRLSAIRIKPRYFRMKDRTKAVLQKIPGGDGLTRGISTCKRWMRTAILKETLFELMGFQYLGPADGNDVFAVCHLLEQAKKLNRPVVIHLKTVKGKGYLPSQQDPCDFHGVAAFDRVTGQPVTRQKPDFSAVFGEELCRLAAERPEICAVTAAMSAGTGLAAFAQRYPQRFFDVGIAEEHAVALSAGLAARGAVPVCAIYSTFLQRAYDQILEDIAICRKHVVLAVDRAGLVGADGETHQGIFDVAFLRTVPGLKIFAPANYAELRAALRWAVIQETGPVALRYPRGGEGIFLENTFDQPAALIRPGKDLVVCTYGCMTPVALECARLLEAEGVSVGVFKLNQLTRLEESGVIPVAQEFGRLLVLEDCQIEGCVGQAIAQLLAERGVLARLKLCNLGSRFIPQGKVEQLYAAYGLDALSVARQAKELLHG